ncbi:MAG: hypothetical protein HY565_03330 [Candidatus Kerfeldbacteria bacterium]|nr:hypothetical protein [Candidatus Kerfeldbacteria bacterium]
MPVKLWYTKLMIHIPKAAWLGLVLVGFVGCTQQSSVTDQVVVNQNTNQDTSLVMEYWQIQGSGHSYIDATKIVDDGSTLSYAFRYGSWADDELAGTTKFYYNPSPKQGGFSGVRPATNNTTATDFASISNFEPSDNGIRLTCDQNHKDNCPASAAYSMTASQAIPLTSSETIRLFFEAQDLSVQGPTTTQIYYLDSQDGYVGEDFNEGTSTVCGGTGSTDYSSDGDCALTIAIAANEETGLTQARQFKIGYPTLDSTQWDEAVGTFMVITGADQCEQTRDGLFYATWDGVAWNVLQDDEGCAQPLVPYAHGPVIVYVGAGLYKMYYEDYLSDAPIGSVTKPLHYITADASRTGDPEIVEFEDWDSYENPGEVTFLWPDGTELTDNEEAGLGDHFIYVPNGLDSRVMYMNLGGFDNRTSPTPSNGLGVALPIER